MAITGNSYTSGITARKARNERLERQDRIDIENENAALKQELQRLRRVEEYLNELLSTTGEGPGEWATNVAIKMREIKAALEEQK